MKIESSAGAIIIRKTKPEEVLLIRDMNGNLTFPKGLVEEHEKDNLSETAKREAMEETGITGLTMVKPFAPIQYFYTRNGERIRKQVQYFLFSHDGTCDLKPQKEEGISEVLWMPMDEALERIGYSSTNKPLLEEAMKHT